MKIGILFIATGRYICFWKNFYKSCEKYFLTNHEKTYFLFTDAELKKIPSNVILIKHNHLEWPYETLLRFETFLKAEEQLQGMDYIYFINGTMKPVSKIGEEILPSKEQGLMVVENQWHYKIDPDKFKSYERNPLSTAYIPYGTTRQNVIGGFNGGTSEAYLEMIHKLAESTQKDLKNNIIAILHDESHLNKYILDKNVLTLPPNYGILEFNPLWESVYPNKENLKEFQKNKKMIILNKNSPRYGGPDYMRGVTNKKEFSFLTYFGGFFRKSKNFIKNQIIKSVLIKVKKYGNYLKFN